MLVVFGAVEGRGCARIVHSSCRDEMFDQCVKRTEVNKSTCIPDCPSLTWNSFMKIFAYQEVREYCVKNNVFCADFENALCKLRMTETQFTQDPL